jgi:hypothetical protein
MAGISEIEQAPKGGIRVGFADLEQGEVGGVGGREGELVDGGDDTCVCDGPFEVAGGFAADYACRGGGGVARVGG